MIKPVNLKEVEQTSDHFTEMLEAIQNNKYQDSHLQGLRDCRGLFDTWIAQLHKENSKLKAELKQKDEKLSEFIEGVPIEKAKEGGDYYCLDLGYCVATYFENGQWYYSDDGPNRNPCEVSNRLYPLPSTDTKEDN